MKESFEKLKKLIADVEVDVEKAANGVHAAGVRVRKAMQEIKDEAQKLRQKVVADRNAEPLPETTAEIDKAANKQVGG